MTESTLPQPPADRLDPADKILVLLAHTSLGRRLLPTVWLMDDGRCSCMLRESSDDTRTCGRGKPGKHPRISQWQTRASCDEEQIIEWHRWQPLANWGWLQDQTFTLDVDVRRGGLESLTQWEEQTGGPEHTLRQRTQSGGLHLIYAQPSDKRGGAIRVQGDVLPGIEVRGLGSYIMVEPSTGWTLENPDVSPREADDDTLRLIHRHGVDVGQFSGVSGDDVSGAGENGVGKTKKRKSSGTRSDLPATTWFEANGFGGHTGSRNVDAYRLAWRLLALGDRYPEVYSVAQIATIFRRCWQSTDQGESPFEWDECLGSLQSAWKRRERQKKEQYTEQLAMARSLLGGLGGTAGDVTGSIINVPAGGA